MGRIRSSSGAPGTRLFVAVYAYDRAGNASRPAFVAAAFAPSALLPASGSSLSGSPQLSWRGVARATYYNVQVFLGKKRQAVKETVTQVADRLKVQGVAL